MKRIKVPYFSDLNVNRLSDMAILLSEIGASDMVEKVNWVKEFPYKPLTEFNILRTDKSLFIRYFVRGNMLKAVYSQDQSPVYKDSCVEFFCQVPGSDFYYNFEFNCIGTCSAARRKGRNEGVERLNEEELQQINRFSSIGRKVFKEMQGLFEWELTVEIPLSIIGIDAALMPTHILGNFYKCADDTVSPHYVSWNAINTEKPDFHRPDFFGIIEL